MANVKLLDRVLAHIEANQDAWDQSAWAILNVNGYGDDELAEFVAEDPQNPACGSAMCFAGWTCALSGWKPLFSKNINTSGVQTATCRNKKGEEADISTKARQLLGLSREDADSLFSEFNDLDDIKDIVSTLIEED